MKFLVLGCNGMAGHMISLYLKEQGHDVLGFAHTKSSLIDSVTGDARDAAFIKDIIGVDKFDAIINCIGLLNKTCDEYPAMAVYLNSYFPHQLAELTEGTHTQVIQMSTDCVFSGNRGGYCEYDLRDGETFYDRTKALGELEDDKNVTIRSSIVGPDLNPDGIGLFNWFMKQKGEIYGFNRVMWSGQTTLQYGKTVEVVAKEKVSGIFNIVPNTSISKCDLLKLFNKYFRNNSILITPNNVPVSDKSLKRTRVELSYNVPDYEEMISQMAMWIKKHRVLYPHYQIE